MKPAKPIVLFLKVSFRSFPLCSVFSMFASHGCCGLARPNPASEHVCMWVRPVLPGSAVTSHILIAYCHLTHEEFLCCQLSSGAVRVSGEAQCVAGCPIAQGTRNPMLMCSCHLPSCWFTTQELRGGKSLLLTVQDGWPAPHDDSLWMLPSVTKSYRGTNLCPFHL